MLSPGLRVGYLVAPKPAIQKVVVCMQASTVHTPIFSQMICYRFMKEVDFGAHLDGLRDIYRRKSGLMVEGLKPLSDKIEFVAPEGGLFIWCKLPDGVDMPGFCLNAVQNKVAVVPGSAFMPTAADTTQCFRLNFSTPTDEQLKKGMDILGEIVRNTL